jgi:DNA repair photolyase
VVKLLNPKRKIQYDTIHAKSLLNRVTAQSMPFEWSINPYRGCQHGCSFCYARSTHAFLGMETNDTFQNHILIKSNGAEVLEEQLHKLAKGRKGIASLGRVAIGTATDPYQPAEAKARITEMCLELLVHYQVPTTITTRSPLVLRDIKWLQKIPNCAVNFSLNTLDPTIWRSLEPSTPSPAKRLDAVRQLVGAGVPSGIFMAPIMPYLTDDAVGMDALLKSAAEHNAQFVMASYLRLSTPEVKLWFFKTLEQAYPHLVKRYGALYHRAAYVKGSYKDPKLQLITELREKYNIPGIEPYQKKVKTEKLQPAQLSFSF